MNTPEGNKSVSADNVELLRSILEVQHSRHVTREEATEIGESLLTFFETLGSETQENE
jgi:hypothetical protein